MIVYNCDHCGDPKDENTGYKVVIYKGKNDSKPQVIDLDEKCKKAFDEWLKNKK